jgi:hypothetical protein
MRLRIRGSIRSDIARSVCSISVLGAAGLLTVLRQDFEYSVLSQDRQYSGLMYSDFCRNTVAWSRSLCTLVAGARP